MNSDQMPSQANAFTVEWAPPGAGRGQGDSAGTAHDDLGTEAALECGDVLGDGWWCEVEGCGRLAEAAVFGHSPQDAEPLHIDQQ